MKNELKIRKHFKSSVDRVYAAWTQPELFSQWMGPGNVTCTKVDIDLSVDGSYEIHMQTDGGMKIAYGRYTTIEPNRSLAFTWRWKDSDMPESLVSLNFTEKNNGTEMLLHHTLLPSEESAEHHTEGWNGSIAKLENYLQQN